MLKAKPWPEFIDMPAPPRVFLVTGAASGIGAACCRRLAGPDTAFLVHTRRNLVGAEQVAASICEAGGQAEVMLGDIADAALPGALVARAVACFGGLDVVVANAGFADKTKFNELSDLNFGRSLETILWAFLRLARAALPVLAKSESPRLLAISSFVAHVFRPDTSGFPATAAAKAGVEALVRAIAVEAAANGITANAVAPGFTRKDATGHSALDPAQWAAVVSRIPLGRLGTPQDVAHTVAFLASPEAGYITGQVLHVNGGLV